MSIHTRIGACLTAVALSIALTAVIVQPASADVYPVPSGGTTDTRPGAHGDLTVNSTFTYSDPNEDLRRVVIDYPTGGVGNPNAIPFADRCTKETFRNSVCDNKALIGEVKITVTAAAIAPIDLTGQIFILQTTPEVPTEVGAYIAPTVAGVTQPIRSEAVFYPVTDGPDADLRVRSVTADFPRTTEILGIETPIQVSFYQQKLYGKLANGNVFITNPSNCGAWVSYGYLQAYDSNTNANADPLLTGSNDFVKTDPYPVTPDCSSLAPFNTEADAKVLGGSRGEPAQFTAELAIPNLGAEPQSPATPKTIVTTLPDALNVDVQQLGRICTSAAFAARSCPATTKIGTVSITTPMIAAGLQGEAYLVQATPGHNLPDLGVIARGAITFNLRGSNRYVNRTQIQTTFDDIPQVGFTSFNLTIAGGKNGLLLVDQCPLSGREPKDGGSTVFAMTSYQGQSRTIASPTKYLPPSCGSYSVKLKRITKCLKGRAFSFTPIIKSRGNVRYVKTFVLGKQVNKVKKSPFTARIKLSKKVRAGRTYKYKVKVYFKPEAKYPKGRIITRTGHFRLCR
ncbi:MAG: hypothetical protein JHC98_08185 [Thermoleophilaceae bacterium]|nr:hypothetical protein [Thermoleophilaceae bacterium]